MCRKVYVLTGLLALALLVAALVPARPAAAAGPLVCLDPGHGGSDPGAINTAFGLQEKDINLDVAFRLGALLEANGYTVAYTRTADTYLTNEDRYTYCNGVGADILVSVHTNSSTNPEQDGTMTLYMKRTDVALASALQSAMYPALAGVEWTFVDFGLSKFASGVLLKSDMPAAMLEPVLMSHPDEAALLAAPDGARRQAIAAAAYEGVAAYFAANPPGDDGGGDEEPPNCPPKSNKPGC